MKEGDEGEAFFFFLFFFFFSKCRGKVSRDLRGFQQLVRTPRKQTAVVLHMRRRTYLGFQTIKGYRENWLTHYNPVIYKRLGP